MSNVLFIDNDESLLRSFKRTSKVGKYPFKVFTETHASEALQIVIENDISVVVADTSLDGVNCKAFFEELREFNPSIIRITLSSNINNLESFNDDGQTHANIAKPCESKFILNWIEKLFIYRKYKNYSTN